MTPRNLTFAGAGLTILGLFLPIVSLPIVGGISLFASGNNPTAWSLLVLAALALFFAFNGFVERVFWPALAAAGVLAFAFIRLQIDLASMRASMAEQLDDNMFAGFIEGAMASVQLQWGWLVLAVAVGTMLYAAVQAKREAAQALWAFSEPAERTIAAIALIALVVPVGFGLYKWATAAEVPGIASDVEIPGAPIADDLHSTAATPSNEEANYIRNNLELYALDARYFDSLLDGRVPGVTFKIRNKGNRTLNRVTVVVKFQDKDGNAIAEEEFNPVLVSEYSFGDDNTPLRPNYIWQQDSDRFYTAKSVPSEWETGKATATITAIEFGPDEAAP